MKWILMITLMAISFVCPAQSDERVSTIDFVQVLNDNKAETLYYYQHNWEELRKEALAKGYIDSYQLLEAQASIAEPFQFMLVTTYADKVQYDTREAHFKELIAQQGEVKLLNDIPKSEFRKILFSKEIIRHWNN
jgi:hypothetical protein